MQPKLSLQLFQVPYLLQNRRAALQLHVHTFQSQRTPDNYTPGIFIQACDEKTSTLVMLFSLWLVFVEWVLRASSAASPGGNARHAETCALVQRLSDPLGSHLTAEPNRPAS